MTKKEEEEGEPYSMNKVVAWSGLKQTATHKKRHSTHTNYN